MQELTLTWGAWHGDAPLRLTVPEDWSVNVLTGRAPSALSGAEVREAFAHPIGSPPLRILAAGKPSAAIVIDDLSRPTPTAELIPLILDELLRGGLSREAITVVIGSGTHRPATQEEIVKKVGPACSGAIRVVPHDAARGMVWHGRSPRGTPVTVNPVIAGSALTIGVGAICPHPIAGFSGGSKTIVPGVCGIETAQALHDYQPGARLPGESLTNAFRQEVDAVAALVGLQYVVNVVLTPARRIAAVFAGSPGAAYAEGVAFARRAYTVAPPTDADIVIANAYPFDTSFKVMWRGCWPLELARPGSSKVLLGAAPDGLGSHAEAGSGPDSWSGAARWFRAPQPRAIAAALRMLRAKARRRAIDYLILCPGIDEATLRRAHPRTALFHAWEPLREQLLLRHRIPAVRVAVYPYAPLQMPQRAD